MRVVVVGAGVGGLAAAVRLAAAGHAVTVLERGPAPGGKCGRLVLGDHRFDTGPSLLTMPWVFADLLAATGSRLEDEVELMRVEPVTRYWFADGSQVDLSADLPAALEALEAWSPGAGADWVRFLGTCAGMWRASVPFLTGPPPFSRSALPSRVARPAAPPDPRDFLRVKPWLTLRGLGRGLVRDPRLRMVVERFATYAGGDPRRTPAALAVAGYVEHAFGAWHVRGGLYALVEALVRRLDALGGQLVCERAVEGITVRDGRVAGVDTAAGHTAAEVVVFDGDAARLGALLPAGARRTSRPAGALGTPPSSARGGRGRMLAASRGGVSGGMFAGARLGRRAANAAERRSLSGYALMLGLRGRTPDGAHHTIHFPADYDAEFDDVFVRRRLVRDPTTYVAAPTVTDPSDAPAGDESWFVLVNAPPTGASADEGYEEALIDRLGVRGRVGVRARRTPADLERETGAPGGAIYGRAPHGRLSSLTRPRPQVRGVRGLLRVGGTVHPGGGLPLVALGAATVARLVGPA
jgi:phytoene dehydrogenase-like protein